MSDKAYHCHKCGSIHADGPCPNLNAQWKLAQVSGSVFPTDILSVRAAKISAEIFAIIHDPNPGDLSNEQLVTAVILRELKRTQNDQALRPARGESET